MASIGDVMLRVLADFAGFEGEVTKGAQKAGDKAGEAMSKSMSSRLKSNAGKVVLGGIAVAAGIATKGILELEEVTASFRAETGATAEEAERAGKAINAMAGRNIQPLEEVGRTLAKVHTDLGLSGDAAERAAEAFLKYGRATGRDAAEGVSALDDILDAWNLDASKSVEVMDKLIVSHQKYGGSISENEKALSDLAPQLQALNLDIDDGIALLNVFASSGLDASKAQFALNSAISKLPKGVTMEDFVRQLAAIEDDGERARKAIEVFGSRAGAGLANALRPGVDSLDAFKVTTSEATGATRDAADALDQTFGSRFKLLLKGAAAALIDFGRDWGSALTGVASAASLLGALGVDDIFRKIAPNLVAALKRAGRAGGEALSDGIQSVITGAQGTVIGNFFASRIETIVDSTKNSKLGAIWRAAGDKAATLYLKALIAGDRLVEVMSTMFGRLPGSARVGAAVTKAGTVLGGKFGIAFKLAAVIGIAAIADEIKPTVDKAAQDTHDAIFGKDGPLGAVGPGLEDIGRTLENLPWPLGPKGAPDWARIGSDTERGLETAIERPLANAARDGFPAGTAVTQAVAQGIAAGAPKVKSAMELVTAGPTSMARRNGAFIGNTFIQAFYRGITERQSLVQLALQNATQLSQTTMDKATETAYLLATLTSKEIVRGVNDKRDNVRAAYQETVRLALQRLEQLAPEGQNLTKKAWNALIKATHSKIPEVAAAAQKIVDRIEGKVASTKTRPAGRKAALDYAAGIRSGQGAVGSAAAALAKRLLFDLLARLRAAGGGTIPVSGHQHGGVAPAHQAVIVGERRPELFVPEVTGHVYPTIAQGMEHVGGGGDTIINVPVQGMMPVRSPRDIVTELIRVRDVGILPQSRVAPLYRRQAGT